MGSRWTRRLPSGCLLVPTLAWALSGSCVFDSSNETPLVDAGLPDGMQTPPTDAGGDCDVAIAVNSATEPLTGEPGSPYARVLIGDTVLLQALGSCADADGAAFSWHVGPGGNPIESTALPDLSSPTITVYPLDANSGQAYTVTLEITVPGFALPTTISINAFQAVGWLPLNVLPTFNADANDVNQLATSRDYLWVAGKTGAYRGDLTDPSGEDFPVVDSLYGGANIDETDLSAVHYSAASDLVWFGNKGSSDIAWKLTPGGVDVTAVTLPESMKVLDICDADPGARLSSDKGIFVADANTSFSDEVNKNDAAAVEQALGAGWGGGNRLYALADDSSIDVFPGGGSNNISSLVASDDALWIGSNGKGVATYDGAAVVELFNQGNSGLQTDKVRALAIDSAGDIWAATESGVCRFKSDRRVWVPMGAMAGLSGLLDLRAIAVDNYDGRRAIYAGGRPGLVILTVP